MAQSPTKNLLHKQNFMCGPLPMYYSFTSVVRGHTRSDKNKMYFVYSSIICGSLWFFYVACGLSKCFIWTQR